ncbi:asparagine synthase (glutamine-hydrolyzing), partial [Palleronia sp.]|uniref:asparagine synthase (glutamine-hydrolyzing) n=1 Tax=Palleronia sp. TaxID=1940284 RepID=UPI0035C7CAD4
MCGIAGIFAPEAENPDLLTDDTLRSMASTLAHRGPDADGVWLDCAAGLGLAHRRLSILDLSPAGAQPMLSRNETLVLVFNGEIYNHGLLREELGPRDWRGESDTETLLEAIAAWGLEQTLQRAYGMFALALWDRSREVLFLARDRMGEKPLYLADLVSGWAFASELHALRAVPGYSARLSSSGVESYLSRSVVADDACILKNVRKIPPGHILRIEGQAQKLQLIPFDTVSTMIERGRAAKSRHPSPESAVDHVECVLREVVASQMISDVPVGSFLSGGIDSSLITALMQEVSDRPVKTFSIGFDESGYDESTHAEQVAAHLGTDHRTFRVREQDALEFVPKLPKIYSEVFSDSSQIPTALLCQLARQEVTVALTGDGGDEVFGGYTRHFMAPRLWTRLNRIPIVFRRHGKAVGQAVQWFGGGQSPLLRDLFRRVGLPASALD